MFEERSEPATARRRRKAREDGQVARSAELVGAAVLLGILSVAGHLVPGVTWRAHEYCVQAFAEAARGSVTPRALHHLVADGLRQAVLIAGPILGAVVLFGFSSNVAQVGWCFCPKLLRPQWSRLNPALGARRLFAARSALELLKGVAKLVLVAAVGWHYLSGRRETLLGLSSTDPAQIAPSVGMLAREMALQMVATLALLAGIDYAYQRWIFERSLRMTKHEVREELRETEGRPEVRAQIRARQRQVWRRRMMAAVPLASVVIVNPTHYAVALKYTLGRDVAPTVVAKGRDRIAQRIREIAESHRIPSVSNPPLARSLYQLVEIDQEIPQELFRAVAEVLAMVWQSDRRAGIG